MATQTAARRSVRRAAFPRPAGRRAGGPFPPLTRRGLFAAGGSFGAAALLTACGDGSGDAADGGDGSGSGWTFTDDRGDRLELDGTPERIVGYVGSAAALYDYGIECTGVFGPTVLANGEPDVQAANLDVDRLTVLGNAWGEFNVEEYARLEPQLLVSNMHVPPELWYVPEDSADEILSLAPSAGILTQGSSLLSVVERYAELAEALGADLAAASATEARTGFEDAAETLRGTARDAQGLRVLALSATPDLLYLAVPGDFSDLTYYRDLGVEFVVPEDVDEGGHWQTVSWENADLYPADLILVDGRTGNLQPADLDRDKPTWRTLPAVQAGQVATWTPEPTYSYAGCTPPLTALADAVRAARPLG
ncbi:ABC transporter substrate-binding protein [Streptomyces sp. B6B3]|uniref:ABC transporter substrate-binding protein n=1 Tax=Streptomyces sp. B6B3 TaxID=3153570 RepID=UPI00325F5D47